jgi:hypothetical protein
MVRVVAFVCLFFTASALHAQPLWPGATYDPKIPTIKSVLGYEFGEEITSPDNLVTASPQGTSSASSRSCRP